MRSGAFTEYDEEGRLHREGRYSDDRLSGVIKDYFADGKSSVVRYRDGQPVPSREKRRAKDRAQTKPATEQQPARSEKKKKKKETNGSFLLGHTGKIITLKSPSLLSRHYSLYRNERLIGTIDSEKRGVSLPPIQYTAVFDKAEIENIYELILFSMRLTTFD